MAATTAAYHQHPVMITRPGGPHGGPAAVRPAGPGGPGQVPSSKMRLPRHTRSVTDNQQPGVHPRHGLCAVRNVVTATPLRRWLPAERYSKDDGNPTRSATAVTATTPPPCAAASGKAAQALPDTAWVVMGISPSQSSSSLARWFSGENALTTANAPACSAPSGRCLIRDGMGVQVPPTGPLPQAWAQVSLGQVLLVRLVRSTTA